MVECYLCRKSDESLIAYYKLSFEEAIEEAQVYFSFGCICDATNDNEIIIDKGNDIILCMQGSNIGKYI